MADIPGQPSAEISLLDPRKLSNSYRPLTSSPLAMKATASRPSRASVDRHGIFDFDKIIMASSIWKRNRRTNTWKPMRLVLRPHTLSIYNKQDETQLRHQISLSNITAIAQHGSYIGKQRVGLFRVFTLTRTFHLEAESNEAAMIWINTIRKEAGLDQDLPFKSSTNSEYDRIKRDQTATSFESARRFQPTTTTLNASLPENDCNTDTLSPTSASLCISYRPTSVSQTQLTDEHGTQSVESSLDSSLQEGHENAWHSLDGFRGRVSSADSSLSSSPAVNHNSLLSFTAVTGRGTFDQLQPQKDDQERVTWQGYLHCRLSQNGIRSWKKYWVVLRMQNLVLYKDEEEYAALLIIPLSIMMDVVEVESRSRKRDMMQVITDEREYKFCALDEEDLANWIGRIKSALARRREARL